MQSEAEDVVIKRVKHLAGDNDNETSKQIKPKNKGKQKLALKDELTNQYNRNLKVFGILLFLFSAFIFIALVSYTPHDEVNSEISFHDIVGLIKGDPQTILKAKSTFNWLGLVGAFIANILYNHTLGYSVILFTGLLALWAKNIYFIKLFNPKLIKLTVFLTSVSLIFSSFMGTLSRIPSFNHIPKEWIGSIGYFTSSFLTGFIGIAGSILLLVTAAVLAIMLGTNLNLDIFLQKIKDLIKLTLNRLITYFKVNKDKAITSKPSKELNIETNVSEKPSDDNDFEEPARFIRRMTDTEQSQTVKDPHEPPDLFKKVFDTKINKYPMNRTEIPKSNEENSISQVKNSIPGFIPINRLQNDYPSTDHDISEENKKNLQKDLKLEILKSTLKPDDNIELIEEDDEISNEVENEIIKPEELIVSQKPLMVTLHEVTNKEVSKLVNPLSSNNLDEEINYKPPTINLLIDDEDQHPINELELKQNAKILQEKLETFKIYIENLSVTPGPVVTQYEFVPAAGIKISKISALSDDISMALKAKGIRIISPIPGKGTVGIEIPNQNPSTVRFSSCVKSSKFHNTNLRLPIVLGKTISGEVFTADLAKMPHLLIAGATGSGKSVGINTIINSLIFRIHPKNLKFVIIDPKKVELRQYEQLENHFLAISPDIDNSIITDPMEAVIVLKAICAEMDKRYDVLASVGQRNIVDYNKKVREGAFKNDQHFEHKPMPYIVVIVDELADLMLTASKEVEVPIIRIAQLARAIGIHLVIATQRPSVDVITGIIKANFPARISYLVASKVDSRTVLDVMGAEKLLGNGDMLFQTGGSPHPLRIQNSFLSTEEVENICDFIGNQKGYSQPYLLPSLNEYAQNVTGISPDERDPLFEEAARLIVRHQQGSVSLIQRRLKVGYARAGRIVDELERAGVVGPFDGSKARIVFMESESELEAIL